MPLQRHRGPVFCDNLLKSKICILGCGCDIHPSRNPWFVIVATRDGLYLRRKAKAEMFQGGCIGFGMEDQRGVFQPFIQAVVYDLQAVVPVENLPERGKFSVFENNIIIEFVVDLVESHIVGIIIGGFQ